MAERKWRGRAGLVAFAVLLVCIVAFFASWSGGNRPDAAAIAPAVPDVAQDIVGQADHSPGPPALAAPDATPAEPLKEAGGRSMRSRALRISLASSGAAELLASTPSPSPPLHQRHARLAPGLLLVIGYVSGVEHWRITVPDPRVQRLETFAADGTIAHAGGEQLVAAELSLAVPLSPPVTRVEIHDPQWNGTEYELLLLAAYTF